MSIHKHGNGFRASVWDPIAKKNVFSKTVDKRSDAKKLEIQLMKRVEAGTEAATKTTLNDAYDLWFQTVRKNVAERTLDGYKYNWSHYVGALKDKNVQKITPADIVRWRIDMEGEYAPETVNKSLSLIGMVLDFCRDVLRVIDASPAEHVARCKIKAVVHPTWDKDQIRQFLDFAKKEGSMYYAPLALLCTTGMRPGECCGLLESDLKPNGSLVLHRGLNNHGNATEMKTERSHRTIALTQQMAAILRQHIREKHKIGCMRQEMFVSRALEPLRPELLSNQFRAILGRYNASHAVQLPYIRLYDIRHSFATNNLMNGAKSKLISEVMGNSVNTMEHHYAHLRETMHEDLLRQYGAELFKNIAKSIAKTQKNGP